MVLAQWLPVVFDGVHHVAAGSSVVGDIVVGAVFDGYRRIFFVFAEGGILSADVVDFVGDHGVVLAFNGDAVIPRRADVVFHHQVVVGSNRDAVVKGRIADVFGDDAAIHPFGDADAFKGGG